MKGILGRKLGMTQVFSEEGVLIPVTVIEATPNVVMQKKTMENDGYNAIQLGFEDVKENRANKAEKGHASKANTTPKKFIREFKGMDELEVGQEVKVDIFSAGDMVDVTGVSKGKGYMGTIYRNNAARGPRSHGSGHHRHIGSLASAGRIAVIRKGAAMAGHEGVLTTTNQNLQVIKVDVEQNYILVKGNVPGPKRGLVVVKETVKSVKNKKAVDLLSYDKAEEEAE
ncbi:MAG: 50S ribosomal protein L3 [Bacillota bacterium]|jgi:large subunit ribosomal protein L3|nr:50S ribosomal protein L3 [Bacillota bacterium]